MNLELRFNLPDQPERTVRVDEQRMLIGSLLSNEVVVNAPGIEPIHAMIERNDRGELVIIDLGSSGGVKVNGTQVEVEAGIGMGDRLTIGDVDLFCQEWNQIPVVPMAQGQSATGSSHTAPPLPPRADHSHVSGADSQINHREGGDHHVSHLSEHGQALSDAEKRASEGQLFSPRKARPRGDILEVVSYWSDTILDVELFSPGMKGFEQCTIGDPTKSHMLAGGKANVDMHVFATPREDGFRLNLLEGMKARIRQGGEVKQKVGPAKVKLGMKDIAHVSYDAVNYFVLYVKPPPLDLPPSKAKDPLFAALLFLSLVFYFIAVPLIWLADPVPAEDEAEDTWALVNLPEKKEAPKKLKKPEPQKKPPEKPKQEVKKKEIVPPKKPPPPKLKPPETVKPTQKPVKQPPREKQKTEKVEKAQAVNKELNKAQTTPAKTPNLSKLSQKNPKGGMASANALKPNFKLAGAKSDNNSKKTGGAPGSGMNQKGAPRKGTMSHSVRGVEGPKNNKSSGVNLSKLGLGVGKIHNNAGPGAIHSQFKNSAGGLGGGSGSGAKTLGFGGGVGNGRSLGLAGSQGALNAFGNGAGGPGSGLGGSGGLGGAGLGQGFGKGGSGGNGRANVVIPPGNPVTSGGLTSQEVQAVIRANLNQIRHCYEQLLQRSPSASGKIKVNFQVGVNGRVQSASIVSSSISDAKMQGCVTGKVQRWKFPNPRGGQPVNVTYPFVFNPL